MKCSYLHSNDNIRIVDYERDGKGIADVVMEKLGMSSWLESR